MLICLCKLFLVEKKYFEDVLIVVEFLFVWVKIVIWFVWFFYLVDGVGYFVNEYIEIKLILFCF